MFIPSLSKKDNWDRLHSMEQFPRNLVYSIRYQKCLNSATLFPFYRTFSFIDGSSFFFCCRKFDSTQLRGPIPTELGNCSMLRSMYVKPILPLPFEWVKTNSIFFFFQRGLVWITLCSISQDQWYPSDRARKNKAKQYV
jgi:hypothetical protein